MNRRRHLNPSFSKSADGEHKLPRNGSPAPRSGEVFRGRKASLSASRPVSSTAEVAQQQTRPSDPPVSVGAASCVRWLFRVTLTCDARFGWYSLALCRSSVPCLPTIANCALSSRRKCARETRMWYVALGVIVPILQKGSAISSARGSVWFDSGAARGGW
jgi:hypothetical protein